MSGLRSFVALLALLPLLPSSGCGASEEEAPTARPRTQSEHSEARALEVRDVDAPARRPGEKPLPAFEGTTLDGTSLSISSMIGKRLLLFFFNPEIESSKPVASAVGAVSALATRYNFRAVGIAVGSDGATAQRFAKTHGLDFPILDDASGRIGAKLGLRQPTLVLGADSEGYMSFGIASFPTEAPDAAHRIEQDLRERMRLPTRQLEARDLLEHPAAPLFEAERIEGGEPFRLADYRGKPVVLVFFLHTCPHCHHALEFLKEALPKIPEESRPELVGVSLVDRPSSVRSALREIGLDYFTVLRDGDEAVRTAYAAYAGVPDLVLIDREGKISYRSHGWRDRDAGLMRMQLSKLAGTSIPMLLAKQGYTGNDACGVCHELELRSWEYTQHASALDTLVTHDSSRDPECVSCHVVGFGQAGGWSFEAPETHLEGVGCESCHGRGGPHLSPSHVVESNYEPVCTTCHNPTHSLGFEYASFRPRISHAAIAELSPARREAMLAGRAKPRDVLPTTAAHVGSDACQSCHGAEYASWEKGPHASAVASLQAAGKTGDADCLRCHTTGFGKDGGFPKDGVPAHDEDLARVGCESCHGPGGAHVAEGATRLGSIVSLGDKCDSCVILQICGSCHDHENDPDFEFSVQEHIDRQRHGTIEAGTGRPLDTAARQSEQMRSGIARALAASAGAATAPLP